jgi:hypothetical protein
MTRNANISVQNKFTKGLITEATVLTFPEDACTETFNCEFDNVGNVTRRLGFDHEGNNVTANQSLTGSAITTFLWKNVAGEADISFVVTQTGDVLHFYKVISDAPLSANKHATTISLPTYAAGGATTVSTLPCQFSAGQGYLFVTNENTDPFYVSYNVSANTISSARITIKIRDFKGSGEDVRIDERPTSLTDQHRYDLANQGWPSRFVGASATSNTIGTGSKSFTITDLTKFSGKVGDIIRVFSNATPGSLGGSTNTGNIMRGVITGLAGSGLTVNVFGTNGAGTLSDWSLVDDPDFITAWNIVFGNYPSNTDIWWLYKDSTDKFAPSAKYLDRLTGTTAAPRGHFILDAFNENRATAAGLPGISTVSTGTQRPGTCAFFAGRVWYAGTQFQGYNSRIYFSQLVSSPLEFGKCYQENDPTSETSFDLLPTDGGVIDLIDAGTILKMFPLRNSLLIFCSNGIWALSGSQGLGFTAVDFSIDKLATQYDISTSSFVDVDGTPFWWSLEGIYTLSVDTQTNRMGVQSITDGVLRSFIQGIPLENRKYIQGAFDTEDKIITWVYRSTAAGPFEEKYSYNSMLNYNMLSTAFYPWTVDTTTVKVHSVVATRSQGGQFEKINVIDGTGNNVIDGTGNQVVVFEATQSLSATSSTIFKYFTSYVDAGTTKITFSECFQNTNRDWADIVVGGTAYTSYFVTGYQIRGEGIRKWQSNYVKFFSDATANSSYKVRGIWDFSTAGSSGKWGTAQVVSDFFSAKGTKVKLRGHGGICQFRVENNNDNPFALVGWTVFETSNRWV